MKYFIFSSDMSYCINDEKNALIQVVKNTEKCHLIVKNLSKEKSLLKTLDASSDEITKQEFIEKVSKKTFSIILDILKINKNK